MNEEQFNEWFTERFKLLPNDIMKKAYYDICLESWNESARVIMKITDVHKTKTR